MTKVDTELFELCKQVYEATNLEGNDGEWVKRRNAVIKPFNESELEERVCTDDSRTGIPVYTTEYLLEFMPKRNKEDLFSGIQIMSISENEWAARCKDEDVNYYWGISDTPLKSLLKLTLKLKEEGVI